MKYSANSFYFTPISMLHIAVPLDTLASVCFRVLSSLSLLAPLRTTDGHRRQYSVTSSNPKVNQCSHSCILPLNVVHTQLYLLVGKVSYLTIC
mmetsp:Transcript_4159/g.9296  ORF Transcript_4159/g.9296 Transcript_4159/m.9296 type:complete len:93 (+) Transcript_4159:1096-1374(+)